MKNKKGAVGVLYAQEEPAWGSCRTITANLKASYRDLGERARVLDFPVSNQLASADFRIGGGYLLSVARSILDSGITRLCILESGLPMVALIGALKLLAPMESKRIQFYFHVYGDFTILPEYWQAVGDALEGFAVTLLCASERQGRLVSYFLDPESFASAQICPFPVQCSDFSFSPESRKAERKKLGLHDQRLIFFSGRLSLQKGILTLLSLFEKQADENAVLVLAGECDDIAGSTTGLKFRSGYFYHRFQETLAALPAHVRARVFWLGKVKKEKLSALYSAADLFCSLSLYHDEDFGMAPAEALAGGLPCLLSDWGGYPSFAKVGSPVYLVPVSCSRRGLSLDRAQLATLWGSVPQLSDEERARAGLAFAAHFSIAAISNHLEHLLSLKARPFSGFNWRLQQLRGLSPVRKGFYEEVYGSYLRGAGSERAYGF